MLLAAFINFHFMSREWILTLIFYMMRYFKSPQQGFMLLLPIIIISVITLSQAYIVSFRMHSLEHALLRKEYYYGESFKKVSCSRLNDLYVSYDPDFLSNC